MFSPWTYFETHPGRDFLVYWILMVMIDQMPLPSGNNPFYKWVFGVTHVFSAQLNRAKTGAGIAPNGADVKKAEQLSTEFVEKAEAPPKVKNG